MVSDHDEQKAIGTILENRTNVQTGLNLKIRRGKFSDAQALMPARMTEISLQQLQCPANLSPSLLGILAHGSPERLAQIQRLQSARSSSKLPENRFNFPRF